MNTENLLTEIRALLAAATSADPSMSVLYAAGARHRLERLEDDVRTARASLAAIEGEIARAARVAAEAA